MCTKYICSTRSPFFILKIKVSSVPYRKEGREEKKEKERKEERKKGRKKERKGGREGGRKEERKGGREERRKEKKIYHQPLAFGHSSTFFIHCLG